MFKQSKSHLLLSLIVILSFVYRIFLMLREIYPPGDDIGMHNSIIHSITESGNSGILWNHYHMGGGASLTFPGYHIFVSYLILMTGMPDYLAHSIVASLFSSVIVLVAFLITNKVWTVSAALIVAFLVAFSRFDIEMLMWGGYPNAIALMLIPLTFYFFLQRERFSLHSFLVVASLLSAAVFLTHSLSSIMFVAITFSTSIFVTIFSNRIAVRRTHMFFWLLPLTLGVIIIFPFLMEAIPLYSSAITETLTSGVSDTRLALLSTQTLTLDFVFPFFLYILLIFMFSRKYKRKFFTVPAFLFVMWILVPAMFSQGYLIGFYLDYNRFVYFLYMPIFILIGLAIDQASRFFANIVSTLVSKTRELSRINERAKKILLRLLPHLTRKNFYAGFVLILLMYLLLALSIFAAPSEGIKVQSFYQVMNDPLYKAIQWAKSNTSPDSVFAADATYGWWFSGFAQRRTLSGKEPQYLTLSREFEPAKNVRSLLDSDYIVDNGLIQVREDGNYIARHNPLFLAKLKNSSIPYPFFHFNSNEIAILCREGNDARYFELSQLPKKDIRIENTSVYATITVTRGNQLLNFAQATTVYRGVRFVNMSITLEANLKEVNLDWARFIMHTKHANLIEEENTIALIDAFINVGGQLIFKESQPQTKVYTTENPCCLELLYNLEGKSRAKIEIFVGVFQIPNIHPDAKDQTNYNLNLILNNTKSYAEKVADLPIDIFDYQKFLNDWKISFVVCRDTEAMPRFANDPLFSLVFMNDAVAIFKVKRSVNQLETSPHS